MIDDPDLSGMSELLDREAQALAVQLGAEGVVIIACGTTRRNGWTWDSIGVSGNRCMLEGMLRTRLRRLENQDLPGYSPAD